MSGNLLPSIFTVAGDHSRVAMEELLQQFPKNEKYQYAFVDVLVCEETNATNRFLSLIGAVDNMKPTRKPDFREWILGMHMRAMEAVGDNEEWDKDYIRFLKQDMVYATGKTPEAIGHWWQIAKKQGEYWKLIKALLEDQFDKPAAVRGTRVIRNKAPTSETNFTKLGKLPEAFACSLLQQVLANKITWRSMQDKILSMKAATRVRIETAKHLAGLGKIAKMERKKNKKDSGRTSKAEHNKLWTEHFHEHVRSVAPAMGKEWVKRWAEILNSVTLSKKYPDSFFDDVVATFDSCTKHSNKKAKKTKASKVYLMCVNIM